MKGPLLGRSRCDELQVRCCYIRQEKQHGSCYKSKADLYQHNSAYKQLKLNRMTREVRLASLIVVGWTKKAVQGTQGLVLNTCNCIEGR
jgi:hypothetical protein